MASDNKGLIAFLCVLGVAIVGLTVGVVVNLIKTEPENPADQSPEVVVADKMEGWDGEISESTKALIFSDNVYSKLEEDSSYDINDAINDYGYTFENSSGNLRFFIAIEYANFVYDNLGDIDLSVGIMSGVEDIASSDSILENYYNSTLRSLYSKSGDEEKAEYYGNVLDKSIDVQEEQ